MKTKKSIKKRIEVKKKVFIVQKPGRAHNLAKKERKVKRLKKSVKDRL